MTNNSYQLKFSLCYIDCTNFKEKELLILRNIIANARLGRQLSFSNYAIITFDNETDKKHEYPNITEIPSYGRGKTNGIIFDIIDEQLKSRFNKCLLYKTQYKTEGYYGYVFYNTETNESNHIFNVSFMPDELCIHIGKSIYILNHEDMYKIK